MLSTPSMGISMPDPSESSSGSSEVSEINRRLMQDEESKYNFTNYTFFSSNANMTHDPEKLVFAMYVITVAYAITFLIGVVGNGWVIFNLLKTRPWSGGMSLSASQRSRLYILVLAISDFLLLLTLPKTVVFFNLGDWMFGAFLCHIQLALEIFSKLFSVLILTAMSLERYFIVCTRWRHSVSRGFLFVPMAVAMTCCVIVPMAIQLYYTELLVIPVYHLDRPELTNHHVCSNVMPDFVFKYFVPYTFATGFAGPLIIMTMCYILLVRHVRQKFRQRVKKGVLSTRSVREPRYMSEMRKSIWRIAIYHFVCWGPFWIFTVTPVLSNSEWLLYARLFANILPYINAAGNWILYAVLNYDVRKHIYSGQKSRTFFFLTSVTL